MIRLPDIPGLQGSAINAPAVRAGAVAAPAEALGNLAQGIADVSEHFHNTAIQVQKQENARIVSEKRQQLAQAYADFQVGLQSDPDPASRMQKTSAFLGEWKGQMDDGNMAPAVRDELVSHFDSFATNAKIRQTEDSARLSVRRSAATFDNEISQAAVNKDMAAGEAAIQTAVASGIMLPEEGEAAKRKLDQQINYQSLRDGISTDPLAAERQFNDPNFKADVTPEARERLKNEAEQEANRYRADFANELIISGKAPTEQELAEMEAAGQMDKATHARWLTKIRSSASPVHDPALYEEQFSMINGYDPAQDPSGRTLAQLRNSIASQNLPEGDIKTLNEKLNERLNPSTSSTPKAKLSKDFFNKIATDFNRGDFGGFRHLVDSDKDPSTKMVWTTNREEYDKAWKLRGEFSQQWRAALDAMPDDASFEQINGAYESLKKSFKDKKPVPDLKFSKPSTLPFDPAETYRKTSGATFGGQPVKAPGVPYSGAAATVFGGPNDPADNGRSAFGGATGPGGKEGTAIPQALLSAKFPGKSKEWISENVRTVVRGPDGLFHTLPVVDLGTAEWVWNKNGRPTLDLTEGAARAIGGKPRYTAGGKLAGLDGVPSIDFAVVSIDTGKPLAGSSWEDVKQAWFTANKPTSNVQIANSLIALRDAWHRANTEAAN